MRKLNFKRLYGRNVLCFGPEGIEFIFDNYENIVVVRGVNKDNAIDTPIETSDESPSNGSGKSSIQDLLMFVLFGRITKSGLINADIIHAHSDGDCCAELEFDNIKIVRTLEPNSLTVFKDGVDITKGGRGMPQATVDEEWGLSDIATSQICIFADSDESAFLELKTEDKREFVENLLGLQKYVGYHENAKKLLTNATKRVKELTGDYERSQNDIDACDKRIVKIEQQEIAWKTTKLNDEKSLYERLKSKQALLESNDEGPALATWEKTQERIAEITTFLETAPTKREESAKTLDDARAKLNDCNVAMTEVRSAISNAQNMIRNRKESLRTCEARILDFTSLKVGQECNVCHGKISSDNFASALLHEQTIAEELQTDIDHHSDVLAQWTEKQTKRQEMIDKLSTFIKAIEPKLNAFDNKVKDHQDELTRLAKIRRPDASAAAKVLEAEISELRSQIKTKQEEITGATPYEEILIAAKQEKADKQAECDKKVLELRTAEKEVPYCEYWVKAFGDKGIRRSIVDGIIPALNTRVAFWLDILIGGKLELKFNNELEPTITRNGTPVKKYRSMSKGERRRINLAISQAFAYVMILNSGHCPSIVFLDEITGGGIDMSGVTGVYNMLFELAKERQVFVTTHNQRLLQMLQGCQTLTIVKENDASKLLK